MFVSETMIGEGGYLTDIGLIPLPEAERELARERVAQRGTLQLADL